MAVFGIDFYGLSKYGTDQVIEFNVQPFLAISWSYDQIKISWTTPTGSWDLFRLVRNRYGYPVTQDDGEVLIETEGQPGVNEFLDIEPIPGEFHYYAIYLRTDPENNGWTRAGVTSCLAIADFGGAEWLFDNIPNYYKYISNGELTTDQVGNSYLWQFIQVFGWGLNYLKTQADVAENMNDPMRVHLEYIEEMCATLGIPFDPEIAGSTMRERVASGTHVDREKGTLPGWRNLINIMTGWDADVQIAPNLLLDDDQSSFVHPQFPDWSPNINYVEGEEVHYNRVWYRANAGGAYGPDQAPSGTTADNTWWNAITDEESTFLLNPRTGGQSTWEGLSFTSGVNDPAIANRLSIGVTSPFDPSVTAYNMLFVRNDSSQTADFGVRSVSRTIEQQNSIAADMTNSQTTLTLTSATPVPASTFPYYVWIDWGKPTQECVKVTAASGTTLTITRGQAETTAVAHTSGAGVFWRESTMDPRQPILDGIPIPWIRDSQSYRDDIEYKTGDVVLYAGRPYVALKASTGVTPPYPQWDQPNEEWAAIGYDRRIGLMLSGYTHQPPTFPDHPSANVYPYMEWYDLKGKLIGTSMSGTKYKSAPSVNIATTTTLPAYADVTTGDHNNINGTGDHTLVIDGVTPGNGDRILVKNEVGSNAIYNGVWQMVLNGSPSAPWRMVRPDDFDESSDLFQYMTFYVRSGTTNAGHSWYLSSAGPYTIGTTNLTFTQNDEPWVDNTIVFDSFGDDWEESIDGREVDTENASWDQVAGSFQVDNFLGGAVYPSDSTIRSVAVLDSGQANCQVGVTFKRDATTGHTQGLVLRYVSDTNYIRASRTALEKWDGTSYTEWATYDVAAEDGDRLVVAMNGNVYTVYLYNGSGSGEDGTGAITVLTYTDSNSTNLSSTTHGIVTE